MKKVNLIGALKNDLDSPMTGPQRVFLNLYRQFIKSGKISIECSWDKNVIIFLKNLLASNADIYHVFHFGVSNILALIIIKYLKRKPFYYTVHGLVHTEIQQGSKLKKYHLIVEYLLMKYSDKVLPVSKDLKKMIIEIYKINPQRLDVIPNGIEEYFLNVKPNFNIYQSNLKLNPGKKIIFTATGTQKIKGITSLLKTIHAIQRDDFILVVAGPKGSIHSEVEREFDNSRIHYIGTLNRAELLSAYYYSDIYIQNSIYETFGIAPLEALALGKPVIISENVQMKTLLEGTSLDKYIVPYVEGNNKLLEEKLNILLDSKILRENLGEIGSKVALENTWEKRVGEYIDTWTN
ncbi:MAG TPA: glycosyltransferase family 4 protein [Niallia sp.]|nr:glycosyltransferase family 4 protein [Niallia sp.]